MTVKQFLHSSIYKDYIQPLGACLIMVISMMLGDHLTGNFYAALGFGLIGFCIAGIIISLITEWEYTQ